MDIILWVFGGSGFPPISAAVKLSELITSAPSLAVNKHRQAVTEMYTCCIVFIESCCMYFFLSCKPKNCSVGGQLVLFLTTFCKRRLAYMWHILYKKRNLSTVYTPQREIYFYFHAYPACSDRLLFSTNTVFFSNQGLSAQF